MDIVHAVVVEKMSHNEAADNFGVSTTQVGRLMKLVKEKKDFLIGKVDADIQKKQKIQTICDITTTMLNSNMRLNNAKMVQEQYEQLH